MSEQAPRYRRAVAALDDLGPTARILEVGCGHGIAVTLLCRRRPNGLVYAIDRSAAMVDAATRRNHKHIWAGRARIAWTSLQDAQLEDASYDAALAIRVRELWTDADATLPVIRAALRPGGRFCLVIDGPDQEHTRSASGTAAAAVADHGFVHIRVDGDAGALTLVATTP